MKLMVSIEDEATPQDIAAVLLQATPLLGDSREIKRELLINLIKNQTEHNERR